MNQLMIATCPEEIKELVAEELKALGGTAIEPGYRCVYFECDEKAFYRMHLHSRLVSRFLKVIKQVPAQTPDILFNKAKRIRWPDYFSPRQTFKLEGVQTERGDDIMPSNLLERKVREGIVDSFQHHCNDVPKVDLQEPQVIIVAFWRRGKCMLSLDTTGKALHKRGYRGSGHPAPVKETLAASMCKFMEYDGMKPFWDPMCGSGTIAIEAAMIALGKAPQIHRKKGQFLFENLQIFNRDLWRKVQDDARQDKAEQLWAPIRATDIESRFIDMTKHNALKARVERYMEFGVQDFFAKGPQEPEGIAITNLPYGERIGEDEAKAVEFYKRIGDHMKQNFKGWRVGLLVPMSAPHKFIGLKPARRIPLLNGSIECRFLIFDIYAGSRKGGG